MRRVLLVFALIVGSFVLADCGRAPVESVKQGSPKLDDFTPFLTRDLTPTRAVQRFGAPSEETGSGLRIFIYRLADGRQLWLGFPGEAPIMYARVRATDGSTTDLQLR